MEDCTVWIKLYYLVLAGLLGLCVGSFLLCAVSRHAAGESFIRGRSHCDACGRELSAGELIPVVSYCVQRGRCRHCGARIPPLCLWAELAGCALFVSALWAGGLNAEGAQLLLLGALLLWVSVSDLVTMEIPDAAILLGIAVRLVFILFSGRILPELLSSALGGVSVSVPVLLLVLVYEKRKKVEAMGGGDIKLLFMTGLYLPWQLNLMAVIFACLFGIAAALIIHHGKQDGAQKPFPFGPAIAAGVWTAALAGQPILGWYLGLF